MSEDKGILAVSAAECWISYLSDRIWSFRGGEWLPSSPVDVGEQVYVMLGERTFYSYGDDNQMPISDFIEEISALAQRAPPRAEVVIKFSAEGMYDDPSSPAYEVGYWRNPTKKERAERAETNRKIAERDAKRAEAAVAKEREEFERLKAKYEA